MCAGSDFYSPSMQSAQLSRVHKLALVHVWFTCASTSSRALKATNRENKVINKEMCCMVPTRGLSYTRINKKHAPTNHPTFHHKTNQCKTLKQGMGNATNLNRVLHIP